MSTFSRSPVISILMGVYNAEKYLGMVIDSLLAQTWQDFELIIVDDGSTDNSSVILQSYADNEERIHILTQENQGVASAVNNGLSLVRGKYIARVDADDYCYPTRLEKQFTYMEANPSVVALGTGVMRVDPVGIPIYPIKIKTEHKAIEKELLAGNGAAICQPSVMLRRDALLQIGGYNPRWRVAQDLDLFLRLAEVGKLANMPEVLVDWRQHLSSASHSRREEQLSVARKVLQDAHQRRGLTFNVCDMIDRLDIPRAIWMQRWGWNALSKGYRKAAFHYAFRSLWLMPFSLNGYKLLVCTIRGW